MQRAPFANDFNLRDPHAGNERRKASRPPWLPEETLPRPPQQQQQVEGASYMSKGDPNPRIHHNQKVHQGFHRENLGLYGMPHQQQQQQQQQQVHVQPSQRPPDGPVQNNAHPAKRAEQRGPASYHQPDDFPQARQERTHQQERHQPNPQPTPHQGDRRHYPDRGAFPPQPQLQPQPQPQLQLQPRQQQQQQHQQRQPRSGPDDQPARRAEDDTELQKALHGFRRSLKARGARGVSALRRKFRVFDDNGNGKLEWEEFHKGLREHHMSPKEMHMLFAHFDRDGSGCVDYDEFLVAVSEPMNARRRELVEQAFRTMDVDGSGMIDLHDVMQRFSAHKHPDVAQVRTLAHSLARSLARCQQLFVV
mmetsp:Transcript_30848/g.59554  ORF Transcript_30848/g.59554 Transcript_30848/m.59554 type:complete len:363 (-) Transcript_30848:1395-2483(-)